MRWQPINHITSGDCSSYYNMQVEGFWHTERDAFAAAAGGPRLRGRPEADPEGMAACGQSLEGFAQMQCWLALGPVNKSITARALHC